MIYIFEGVDCTGKSTCFNSLKERYEKDIIFIKESYTPSVQERKDRVHKMNDLLRQNKTVIYDRATLIDDFVYSGVTSNEEPIFKDQMNLIKEIVQKCVVIHFDCDNEVLLERFKERGDEYVQGFETIQKLKKKYKEIYNFLNVKVLKIDTTYRTINKSVKSIENIIFKKDF